VAKRPCRNCLRLFMPKTLQEMDGGFEQLEELDQLDFEETIIG
jgi:hypothetical protein